MFSKLTLQNRWPIENIFHMVPMIEYPSNLILSILEEGQGRLMPTIRFRSFLDSINKSTWYVHYGYPALFGHTRNRDKNKVRLPDHLPMWVYRYIFKVRTLSYLSAMYN
jgi:hypothetical protein